VTMQARGWMAFQYWDRSQARKAEHAGRRFTTGVERLTEQAQCLLTCPPLLLLLQARHVSGDEKQQVYERRTERNRQEHWEHQVPQRQHAPGRTNQPDVHGTHTGQSGSGSHLQPR
jgi:hypothetical protein